MTVAVLIITHEEVGQRLLDTAIKTLSFCPLRYQVISVNYGSDPELLLFQAQEALFLLDDGDGVLILTDMFGSTPSNIACKLKSQSKIRVVAGINLPMLIRALNYPDLSLQELSEKAISGGREGIVDCTQYEENH